MFREMRTPLSPAISHEDCVELLKSVPRGIMAVLGDDDYPYATPLDHWYNPEDGKLYFHGGPAGHRIDALKKHNKVCYCVMDHGFRREGEWALNITSVVIFGKVEFLEDQEKAMKACRQLSYQFPDDNDFIDHEITYTGPGTLCYALEIEHMTGKFVTED